MRKKGFTLSEIIVSLGIIGIITAITLPLVNNLRVDTDKIKVLKISKTVANINNTLLNNKSIYYSEYLNGSNTKCFGFECTQRPFEERFNNQLYEGNKKYQNLLFAHLETVDNTLTRNNDNNISFQTIDGINWTFTDDFKFYITLDNNGNNCVYSNNCLRPNRFSFRINNNGVIYGDDALTRVYLFNIDKLNDKAGDYAQAKAELNN